MLVSVVIPVYNGADFVVRCLQSVLAQGDCVEAVVVDDGSTDGTGDVVMPMLATCPRIRYLRIDNSGVTAARRRGLDEASGEWICFLDVDDTLPSGAISSYAELLWSNPDIIASGEPDITIDEYKCRLMRRISHPELWGKMFKADFIRRNYPTLDRSVVVGEDQIVNLMLACRAESFVTLRELLYCYNLANPQSVMKSFRRTGEYEVIFERTFDALVKPELNPDNVALLEAEYKMKIEGFKMVVLDGNRFDARSPEWKSVQSYYVDHKGQLAPSERLLLRLCRYQGLYGLIMKSVLALKKI